MKLISMTDFVLEQKKNSFYGQIESSEILQRIENYAEFLKHPLTLGMFLPVDKNGNILKEPKTIVFQDANFDIDEVNIYQEAKEKVLFKYCTVKEIKDKYTSYHVVYYKSHQIWVSWTNRNIEDMIKNNLELTESALKQIGLNP